MTNSGSRAPRGCGPNCTRCWCTARASSSSPTRTRRRTTQWWARWWCRCRRRHRRGAGHRPRRASTTYRASKDKLAFVAFYADCRHQVTPVRSGYRVTLTFNLLSATEPVASEADPTAELVDCLTEHFTTPATRRYGSRDLDPPNRLVFLLDHEYTQRGLNWHRLKGADAERARLVRAAADRAGCEAVLALAEVKETWDALPADHARPGLLRRLLRGRGTRTPPPSSSTT